MTSGFYEERKRMSWRINCPCDNSIIHTQKRGRDWLRVEAFEDVELQRLTQDVLRAVSIVVIIFWKMIDPKTASFVDTCREARGTLTINVTDGQMQGRWQLKDNTVFIIEPQSAYINTLMKTEGIKQTTCWPSSDSTRNLMILKQRSFRKLFFFLYRTY